MQDCYGFLAMNSHVFSLQNAFLQIQFRHPNFLEISWLHNAIRDYTLHYKYSWFFRFVGCMGSTFL